MSGNTSYPVTRSELRFYQDFSDGIRRNPRKRSSGLNLELVVYWVLEAFPGSPSSYPTTTLTVFRPGHHQHHSVETVETKTPPSK